MLPLKSLPAGDELNGHDRTVMNKLQKSDWQSLETWWSATSHKKHSSKNISMMVPQNTDLLLLEVLSGCKYQQLVN